jgi:ABC-type multidrug transport system fused ATPase/permease subunit
MIMSKFEILQNNKIDREITVLDKYTNTAWYFNIKLNNFLVLMFSIPDIVFFIMTLLVLYLLTNQAIPFSILISFFMILSILKENIKWSIDFFKNFTKNLYFVEKLWSLFDDGWEIKWLTTGKDFIYNSWNIEVKNISFSYGENSVFNNFSVIFEWSKKIAFVWTSGSGKTTLVKIISGFLSPNSWDIIVDGQKLGDINLNSYYKNIWYLTQEPSVFDGTILENLTYWMRENTIDDTILYQAIQDAKCEFIYDFTNWLDTQIGEKWVRLSWWQKQRLAIAKLFIKNPQIIILDEPTSALDSFSEEAIKISFEKLFQNKTVFIIAHRLQTVKTADDIIVFEDGKIIERGNHKTLIHKHGYYKKMLDLQSGF